MLFTKQNYDQLEYDKWIVKMDRLRGRKISYKFSPDTGHTLLIEGRGVQDGGHRLTFDINDISEINTLADVLMTGSYEKHLAIG